MRRYFKMRCWSDVDDNVEVHWSEDDMTLALESVKTGTMSINQVRNLESKPAQTSQVSLFLTNK